MVLDADPLDATAVAAVDRLRARLPALLRQANLAGATASVAGDSAAVAAIMHESERDLAAILLAALVVNLLILAVVLRALVAPLLLLACTVLSVAATLGLSGCCSCSGWGIRADVLRPARRRGATRRAGVGLQPLRRRAHPAGGPDRDLRDAMLVALPRSSAAITTAGLALAASLGSLVLVPLRQFAELAFALAVGILLDTYVVRTLLVPALLTVVGPVSGWPGRRLQWSSTTSAAATSPSTSSSAPPSAPIKEAGGSRKLEGSRSRRHRGPAATPRDGATHDPLTILDQPEGEVLDQPAAP